MSKNTSLFDHLEDVELWNQKRLSFFAKGPSEGATEEKEAQKIDADQLELQKHLGLAPEEAKSEVQKSLDVHGKMVNDMVQDWVKNSFMTWRPNLLSKVPGFELIDDQNKADLSQKLTDLAKEEADRRAYEVFSEEEDAEKAEAHALNSLNILGHKSELCSQLITNLSEEIVDLEERQESMSKGMNALQKLISLGADLNNVFDRSKTIQGRINRLKAMQAATEEIKDEADAKLEERNEKKNEVIRGWDENLRSWVRGVLKDQTDEGELNDAVVQLGLEGDRKIFDKIIMKKVKATPGVTQTEINGIEAMAALLLKGNLAGRSRFVSGTLSREWLGDKVGAVTKRDIHSYYLNKVFVVAQSNKEDSLEDRLTKLEDTPPGQEIKVGDRSFFIIRHTEDAFLLRKKGEAKESAILNKKTGTFTELVGEDITTREDGKKVTKPKFAKTQLKANKESTSVTSVDFIVDKAVAKKETVSTVGEVVSEKTFTEKIGDAAKAALDAASKEMFGQ